ncbi:type II toxin-antitoxin system HigB family toxin [Nostoc sp.]|uniref:type II toxin-antitoxin system HigB family toxin n=1 Tax=Nostoc sp. TaxID=1180 RepID=UPI002FFC5D36
MQAVYPEAEAVGNFTVFNIKGNKYRLLVDLVYSDQIIYLTAEFKYLNHICRRGARPCAPTAWSIYLKIAINTF